jgi:hypothetical protein
MNYYLKKETKYTRNGVFEITSRVENFNMVKDLVIETDKELIIYTDHQNGEGSHLNQWVSVIATEKSIEEVTRESFNVAFLPNEEVENIRELFSDRQKEMFDRIINL